MDILKTINTLLANTEEIKKSYPTVENVRHNVFDIPYPQLKSFAQQNHLTLHPDIRENRIHVIYSPIVDGKMDSDIWLYSGIVKIKPAEITEYPLGKI